MSIMSGNPTDSWTDGPNIQLHYVKNSIKMRFGNLITIVLRHK